MAEIPYIATEAIPAGVCCVAAADGSGLEVADGSTRPILGISGLAADEGAEVDLRTPNDGRGPIRAVFGGTVGNADIGKPLTSDSSGRCVLAAAGVADVYTVGTAAGPAALTTVALGPNGRVFVQTGVLPGSGGG